MFNFYNSLVPLKSQLLPQCLVPTSNFLVDQWFNLPIVHSLAIPNPFIFCWLSSPFHLQPSPMFFVPFLSFCVPRSFETATLMKFQASCRDYSLFWNRGDSLGNLEVINSVFWELYQSMLYESACIFWVFYLSHFFNQ